MKKYLIYILLLLFTAPYISSCSDEWTDSDKLSLLTKAEEEEPIVEDDIDISLLKFGFNLNPKAETNELPNADEAWISIFMQKVKSWQKEKKNARY